MYLWNPSTSLNDSTISNPTLTLNNTGTTPDTLIYIVITTLNGCVTTDTVQIVSGPAPVANAGPDVIFCSGQSAPIGTVGTPGYTYTWVPALGLSSSTDPTPTVTLTNSTNVIDTVIYIVTANAFGCTDSDTITILVKPLPLSEAGANTTLCGGDTLVLGTAATTGYSYTWSPTSGLSSSTISNPILVVNNTGTTATTLTYAVLTTWNGCISSDSITITVNPQPIVSAAANPTVICVGATAVLNGSGATNYNWALLTAPLISIGTGNSLNVTPVVTTSYILTGTNGFACSGGDTITVIVNPLPPVLITAVSDTICDGDTITLAATGATSYSWSIAGGGTIGTGPSIQVSPTTNTTYIVTGSDANLCSNSDSINITVNPAPTANGIIGTLSVCPSVTGVQYWISNPNPNSTYTWTVTNGTITSGQGNDTITVDWSSISGAALVSVVEITDLGCVSANPVTLPISINVILTPVAPTGPTVFCANQAQGIVYTTLGTPGSTYNWVAQGGIVVGGNGTNTVTIDWTAPGPQTVLLWYEETSTTTTNVCFGTSDTLSILINPAPSTSAIAGPVNVCVNDSGSFSVTNTFGSTYAWTVTGATLINGNGSNTINVNWPATGTITISIVETNSYGCIGDTVTLPVVVNGLPAANAGPDAGVCIGQAIQLNATGGVNYVWTPATGLNNTTIADPLASPTTSTVYTVLVTDANGCRNDDSVLVTVNALPVITITPNSGVCIGSNIQLSAGGGNVYQWSPASTLDNPNSATPFANPTVNTTYTVIVTDGNGCVDSATVNITVNPLPIAVASADTLICAGTTASLSASGGVSFSWTPTQGLNNGTISNPTATPSSNTTYTVTVTDINGCQDDEQVVIDLNDQPISSFSVDGDALSANCDGIQATLINTSQDALNYTWIFPDGTTSTEVNPLYSFGFYNTNVTLIAYNNICSDTTQLNYSGALLDDVFKDISNVFTPNGDGLNDCFDLGTKYNFSDCSSMKVFNRWGEEVFTLKPGATCWNGKKNGNGEDLPSGSYFLSVHIAGKKYSGTITLIR
ncbi:MAG: gliding motility-associated C-terminal domain-containing protein [Bacteroidetes bacterium]|nr:gliding motility-associated C-terminal domain-containing protein [Bacteroidota bacterium]